MELTVQLICKELGDPEFSLAVKEWTKFPCLIWNICDQASVFHNASCLGGVGMGAPLPSCPAWVASQEHLVGHGMKQDTGMDGPLV